MDLCWQSNVSAWCTPNICSVLESPQPLQLCSIPTSWTTGPAHSRGLIRVGRLCRIKENFHGGSVVKNLPASVKGTGDVSAIPGLRRSPGVGNGNPLQYSCLGNSMDRGVWGFTVHGAAKGWTQLSMQKMRQVLQMMCGGGLFGQEEGNSPWEQRDPLLYNLIWLSVPLSQEPRAFLTKVGALGGRHVPAWEQVPSHFFWPEASEIGLEEKVEEKKKNSTVIESCLLPFERNESGTKQKHRIQTKTKTKILYCFRICLGNNCLTVFCVILKSRVCSTALFCTWPRAVCREAGLWVMILPVTKKHFSFPEYLLPAWGGKEGPRCIGKGVGWGWISS